VFFTLPFSRVLLFACIPRLILGCSVDYILFLTADVTVTANANEIRDYKYVDKAELQAMFEEEGKPAHVRRLCLGE
jgi:isopentenyldiphosphate isomerase